MSWNSRERRKNRRFFVAFYDSGQSPFKFALSTNHCIIAARFGNLKEVLPFGQSPRTRQNPE